MAQPMFSRRARRTARWRTRFKQGVFGMWIVTLLGTAAGIPFATAGSNFVNRVIEQAVPLGGIETSESAASAFRFRASVFHARPVPEPTPTQAEAAEVAPPPASTIPGIIYAAAAEFGLDGAYLVSVASCESNLNPSAYNAAGYHGLFQFDQATWSAYGYGSIYDPAAQARTAARLIAAGQASRWPNCA